MEFNGTQNIAASRQVVWACLNDPQMLQQCIEGCESFTALDDGRWQAVVRASVGPVKARFKGTVTLSERQPLRGYRLSGEGEGGIAGFGRMNAVVTLQDADHGTTLDYVAHATVGGKLAQIGSRLVSSVAMKMADAFFTRFNELVSGMAPDAMPAATWAAALAATSAEDAATDCAGDDDANVVLMVNGRSVRRRVDERTLLVDLLRRDLHLTGTHVGCDTSQCGACTVRLDGLAVKSCSVLAVQASGGEVVTIEGLAPAGSSHPLQEAFVACHGLQCGFCTPGMIMAADGLLRSGLAVNRETICTAIEGNICRCTGYVNIIEAIEHAARAVAGQPASDTRRGNA
jgi:carbon-monoxide dehydrogenase small subunit